MSRLLDLPGPNGLRRKSALAAQQDALMTTHSPFVPSDMSRENVLIFCKNPDSGAVEVRRPEIETFGATFDAILDECFDVRPPMSAEPIREIDALMKSSDPKAIRDGMDRLGYSIEKTFLAERLRRLADPGA